MLAGDRRALARLITAAEDGGAALPAIMKEIHSRTGRAHVVGLTGPPGAGKSTLVWALAAEYGRLGRRVGIIAVDPSSPFSGGAVLGDRVRVPARGAPPGVYFRSMASRGRLGGTPHAVRAAVSLLDAFGKEVVLIETVGAGQSDVAVRTLAHTTVVVSVPGLGDDIQMMKAGILEIADVYAVNKADKEGASRTAAQLSAMIDTGREAARAMGADDPGGWTPPIVCTVATRGEGIPDLVAALERHRQFLQRSGRAELLNRAHAAAAVQDALFTRLEERLARPDVACEHTRLVDEVGARRLDAFRAADLLLARLGASE
ncbi:MAG: methylmalonyl Co-A mutase-associated GTPase MeaB [Firmicutes bacterium]|nr:methylmalonyl Co-A mutase-associated GTPase MeaB [Bacillota bacterium]